MSLFGLGRRERRLVGREVLVPLRLAGLVVALRDLVGVLLALVGGDRRLRGGDGGLRAAKIGVRAEVRLELRDGGPLAAEIGAELALGLRDARQRGGVVRLLLLPAVASAIAVAICARAWRTDRASAARCSAVSPVSVCSRFACAVLRLASASLTAALASVGSMRPRIWPALTC